MPSFSTYMKFAVTLPSSPFGPARNTAAPGFSRLLSPGTGARIGTSGPMLYSDSPSLNLTCTILPCGASVTVPTVALVITLSEPRSHADCRPPSGCACEKIRTSIACSLPSVPLTPAEARKSPALISARDFLTRLWILVASVTATFTSIPFRALTVRFAPSTFSIVPRTRTGGAAGGFCASAGSAKSRATAAATADFRSIPPSPLLGAPTGATAAGICPARQLTQPKGAFINIIGEGQGEIGATMQPPPNGVWGMPADMLRSLPGYDPDVAKNRTQAQDLMKKLGYGPEKRLPVTVTTRNVAAYRDPAVILIDQLKEIFIDGTLNAIDTTQWYPTVMRKDYALAFPVRSEE